MRAVTLRQHGGPEVLTLEDVPIPEIRPDEVLVRVRACALNHLDLWIRQGVRGYRINYPHILGSDVAGVVEQAGELVTWVQPGDEVIIAPGIGCGHCWACTHGLESQCPDYSILGAGPYWGGYAEFVKAPGVNILPKPPGLSFEEAAAIPLVFQTAWHMLVKRAGVRPGETVLVQAGGSGVGSAAIQIARLFGARVITTASSEAKLSKARELGADETINYAETDFVSAVRNFTEGRGVDLVFEHVGGEVFSKSIRILARGGRLVTCGATAGATPEIDLRYIFTRQLAVFGVYMGARADLLEVLQQVEAGRLRPVIDRVLPLEQAAEAHRLLADRAQFGKVVLVP